MLYSSEKIQESFKKVLDSFSFPLKEVEFEEPFVACLNVLVDHNVSINWTLSENYKMYFEIIETEINQCDFLIRDNDLTKEDLLQVKVGSAEFPEKSCTIIVKDNALTRVKASGPGIKEEIETEICLSKTHIETRNEINKEFPLGIDFIVISNNSIISIPRSVKLEVL